MNIKYLQAVLCLNLIIPITYAQAADEVQQNEAAPEPEHKPVVNTVNKAGEIVTQPVRDVGVNKSEIPPVLVEAAEDPYSTVGVKTCRQIASAMAGLNAVLGPDYVVGRQSKENKAGKLAEAGGKTVVNAFIPFRGLVREISGAAPAERRYNAALDAGLVRRGFLRGLALAKGCKPL